MTKTHGPIDFRRFHNLLRVLLNIDYFDMEEIVPEKEWPSFRKNPWRWMIEAPTEQSEKVYLAMIKREGRFQ